MGENTINGYDVSLAYLNRGEKDTETCPLSISSYKYWYDIIKYDRHMDAANILSTSAEKDHLLSGTFLYTETAASCLKERKMTTRPLLLAAVFRSDKVLDVMLDHGADPEVTEVDGSNILHCLVRASAYSYYVNDDKLVQLFDQLKEKLPYEKLTYLLMMENDMGLRPMEYAAQQGAFTLMMTMFEAAHAVKVEDYDMMEFVWYDITDYEFDPPCGRRTLSPLHFISEMDKRKLNCPSTMDILKTGPMRTWLDAKVHAHMLVFYILALIRLVQVVIFFIVDLDEGLLTSDYNGVPDDSPLEVQANASFVYCSGFSGIYLTKEVRMILIIFMTILSSIYVISLIVKQSQNLFCKTYKNRSYYLTGKRDTIKQSFIYEASSFIFSTLLIVYGITVFMGVKVSLIMADCLRFLLTATAIFIMFYFVQVMPVIGTFIITVIRMTGTMIQFTIVFVMMQVPFVTILTNIMNSHTMEGCIEDFSNPVNAWFTLFRLLLNMADVKKYKIHYHYIVDCIHMQYVFLMGILLLNFLIAVMSNAVNLVDENKHIIMNIQRIVVTGDMERLVAKSKKLRMWLLRKYFTCLDGRLCVVHGRCSVPNEN